MAYDGKQHSQTMLDNQYKKHNEAHREKMRSTPLKVDPYANGEPLTADQLERQMSYMNKQRDAVRSKSWLITQDKKLQIFYDTYLK